jgi:hypothetical protein
MSLDPDVLAKLAKLRGELREPRCESGKRRFATRALAEQFLFSDAIDLSRVKVPRRAYRCPTCGDYHLTAKGRM